MKYHPLTEELWEVYLCDKEVFDLRVRNWLNGKRLEIIKCLQCEKLFEESRRGRKSKFCSRKCRNRLNYLRRNYANYSPKSHSDGKKTKREVTG